MLIAGPRVFLDISGRILNWYNIWEMQLAFSAQIINANPLATTKSNIFLYYLEYLCKPTLFFIMKALEIKKLH